MLLALKIKIAAAAMAAGLAGPAVLVATAPEPGGAAGGSELVTVAAGAARYRLAGEFTRDGRPVAAPLDTYAADAPIRAMRRQVTAGEWRRCVAAGGCPSVK